ncbi:MAG: hypothetical protein Q4F21_00640 [Lachnospiraceae bacterium]|nr:hypothetical protein [Lachnospiraceae bacterium]
MIKKITLLLTLLIILASASFGISKRSTYTNLTRQSDALNHALVAELPENLVQNATDIMFDSLPDTPIIVRVTAAGIYTPYYGGGQQKAIVQEVYQGKNIHVGQTIQIATFRWCCIVEDSPSNSSSKTLYAEMSFVNRMQKGNDYLVFLDKKIDAFQTSDCIYMLADSNYLISPVFSYDEHQNISIPVADDGNTYVNYLSVKDNEFFACTKKALSAMIKLKHTMIKLYPAKH